MGGIFTCVDNVPDFQRLEYDMSPLKFHPVPIVWFVGPSGTGRQTQCQALAENLRYENIRVASLLKDESKKETDRGKLIKIVLNNPPKKIADTLVIDIIKEAMLKTAANAKGFIINGFPRTHKQANLFVKEIADVDVVVYLYSDAQVLLTRTIEKHNHSDIESVKRDIHSYIREVKESVTKFGAKVEKIHTDSPPGDVYGRIEAAINVRINVKPSTSLTDQLKVLNEL